MGLQVTIDENLPVESAELSCDAGHDARIVGEQGLSGRDDFEVVAACRQERRVLVTMDLDFADVRGYPPADHASLVVLRLVRQDRPHVVAVPARLVPTPDLASPDGHLGTVEEPQVCMRPGRTRPRHGGARNALPRCCGGGSPQASPGLAKV